MKNNFAFIDRFEEIVSSICICLIPVILFLQLILRIVNIGVPWFEEILRFIFLCLVYLASAEGVKKGGHFSLTFLTVKLPKKIQKSIDIVKYAIWFGLNTVIIYQSSLYVIKLFERPQRSPILEINMAWIYMIIPLAFSLQILRLIQFIIRSNKG